MNKRINSRQKGARGERLWRDFLREQGYASAHRAQQYCGAAGDADVKCDELPYHFEVKCVESLNLRDAMAQAIGDAAKSGQTPIVAHKRNHGPWLCTLKAEDLFTLIRNQPVGEEANLIALARSQQAA